MTQVILTKTMVTSAAAGAYLQSFEELFGDGYGVLGTEQVAAPDPFPSIFHNGGHELDGQRKTDRECL